MRRVLKFVLVLVGVVGGSFGVAQSEVALAFAARFDARVLEEARHPQGTRVVLFGPLGVEAELPVIEGAVLDAVASTEERMLVAVFPKWFNTNFGGTHAAVVATRSPQGERVVHLYDWYEWVGSGRAGLNVRELVFEFGESHTLATTFAFARPPTPHQPSPPRAATPSPPRNGCVSTTTSSGSSMTCYSDGRVSYRSSCTSVAGRITCRSESY